MAYQIDRFNGTVFSVVPDQTVDTTSCELKLIGRNYAGYGEVQNENFLHLLENFRNTSAPRKPVIGQLWFDESTNKIKYRDSTNTWRSLTVTEVEGTPPTSLTLKDQGNLWFDSTKNQINVWNGSEFVVVGPQQSPGFGVTRLVSDTIRDNGNTEHAIIKVFLDDAVIGTIANEQFDVGVIDSLAGFTTIKKGLTLINTDSSGVTTGDFWLWGSASNAKKLDGYGVESFVLRSTGGSGFDDAGFYIGDGNDLRIFVENGNSPVISNLAGTDFVLRIIDNTETLDYILNPEGFIPGSSNSLDIGSNSNRWKDIYATRILANVQGNVTGNVTGNITGNSFGIHRGNVLNSTGTITAYNSASNTFTGSFSGNLTGNVLGNVVGDTDGDHFGDLYDIDGDIAYNGATRVFFGSEFKGRADTALRLASDVFINGVRFDGSQSISVTDDEKLSRFGGAILGYLTLPGAPIEPNHAATKQYVDTAAINFYTSRPLIFSLDIRGLTNTSIAALLNTLAPVTNYQVGQQARIATTVQTVSNPIITAPTATSPAFYRDTGEFSSINYVTSVSVSTITVNNPIRNNELVFRVNTFRTSWEYVSG
jgi:hypothetical protein